MNQEQSSKPSREELRQKLRGKIQSARNRRTGASNEILVPCNTLGVKTEEEKAAEKRRLEKMVRKKGRKAVMEYLGVTDPAEKTEFATAMVKNDTKALDQLMRARQQKVDSMFQGKGNDEAFYDHV